MYKLRALVFTGNSYPVRVLKTYFKVTPFPEGGGMTSLSNESIQEPFAWLPAARRLSSKSFQIHEFQKAINFQDIFRAFHGWFLAYKSSASAKRVSEEKSSDSEQMAQWQMLFGPCELSSDSNFELAKHTFFFFGTCAGSFCRLLIHSFQSPSPNLTLCQFLS